MFYRPFVKFLLFCDLSLEAPRPERDVYTNRIREPEKQYTVLTDIQKKNIKNVRNSNKIMISHPPLHKVLFSRTQSLSFTTLKKNHFPKVHFTFHDTQTHAVSSTVEGCGTRKEILSVSSLKDTKMNLPRLTTVVEAWLLLNGAQTKLVRLQNLQLFSFGK